jgi:hypothetical protein
VRDADKIRVHGREKYVVPARSRREKRFSIRAGDVVRELKLTGRAPAVCSALKTRKFLQENTLRLVDRNGPTSGQSTTVIYTYEFVDRDDEKSTTTDPWLKVRGIAKDLFAALGGGEAFIREERAKFYGFGNDESGKRR